MAIGCAHGFSRNVHVTDIKPATVAQHHRAVPTAGGWMARCDDVSRLCDRHWHIRSTSPPATPVHSIMTIDHPSVGKQTLCWSGTKATTTLPDLSTALACTHAVGSPLAGAAVRETWKCHTGVRTRSGQCILSHAL